MTTAEEAIKDLQKYNPKDVLAVAVWSIEDVISRGKDRRMTITKEQAEEIIDMVDRKQDATLGISWDTIDAAIDEIL